MMEIEKPPSTFFSLWGRHGELNPQSFAELVTAALEELFINEFYTTQLTIENNPLDLVNPHTGQKLLQSMELAVKIAEEGGYSQVKERLKLELTATREIINLLGSNQRGLILWFSPPGMGLDSDESRVTVLYRENNNQINILSIPTTPNYKMLTDLIRTLTNNDFEPKTTSDFLETIFVQQKTPAEIIQAVHAFNQGIGFTPLTLWPMIDSETRKKIEAIAQNFWLEIQEFPHDRQYQLELDFLNRLKMIILQQLFDEKTRSQFLLYQQTHTTACGSLSSTPPPFLLSTLPLWMLWSNDDEKNKNSVQQPQKLDLTP